jgi:hypothetical protein
MRARGSCSTYTPNSCHSSLPYAISSSTWRRPLKMVSWQPRRLKHAWRQRTRPLLPSASWRLLRMVTPGRRSPALWRGSRRTCSTPSSTSTTCSTWRRSCRRRSPSLPSQRPCGRQTGQGTTAGSTASARSSAASAPRSTAPSCPVLKTSTRRLSGVWVGVRCTFRSSWLCSSRSGWRRA